MIDISLNCYYVIDCYYVMQFYQSLSPHRFLKELFGKHMNLWLHTCHKKEEYYLGIIRHGHPNAVQCIPPKVYQLKEEQLILIIAYQSEVYDNKADFLQAIAETQEAAFIDELPEDNHYLVNEGINDSEYSDSDQPSSDSDEL